MKNYFGEMKESCNFVVSDVFNFHGNEYISHNFIQDKEGLYPARALPEITSLFSPPLRVPTSPNNSDI